MAERQKPDAVVRVNEFDITIYRRGHGLRIDVAKDSQVVGFFGIADTAFSNHQETTTAPVVTPASLPLPIEMQAIANTPALPTAAPAEVKREPLQPVKISGFVAAIEGMGQTPQTGDPVFRFSVKVFDPLTRQEDVKQIAAFRHIGQVLHGLTQSPDPAMKLLPGREISMMAWDHTTTTGSYYPSSVNYLNLPAITNPKRR